MKNNKIYYFNKFFLKNFEKQPPHHNIKIKFVVTILKLFKNECFFVILNHNVISMTGQIFLPLLVQNHT
jgi:hypothetical protein